MDREKVIEHITDCVKIADCQINHNWVFVRTDILRDALALLKAQEPPKDASISSAIECLLHPQDADDSDMAQAIDTAVRALALLKAQEPRVMDFDDVVGGDECWLEAINGACGYADCYACTGTGEVQVFRCKYDNPQYIMAKDYLKTWRCWTSRPTDEQREATPWE